MPAPEREPSQSGFQLSRLAGTLLILIPIAAVIYFLVIWEPDSEPATTPAPVATERPAPVIVPEQDVELPTLADLEPEPEPEPPLPELNNSDPVLHDAVVALNSEPQWRSWFDTDELARKFAIVVDNLSMQEIARKYISVPKPSAPFQIREISGRTYIDPAGYKRYDPYIQTITAVDADTLVDFYVRYGPLFDEAFAELGYADKDLHGTLMLAIDKILATPVIEGNIQLVRPSVFYQFADPDLERLPPLQKQIIRMGPENTRLLFDKLRQVRAELQQRQLQPNDLQRRMP